MDPRCGFAHPLAKILFPFCPCAGPKRHKVQDCRCFPPIWINCSRLDELTLLGTNSVAFTTFELSSTFKLRPSWHLVSYAQRVTAEENHNANVNVVYGNLVWSWQNNPKHGMSWRLLLSWTERLSMLIQNPRFNKGKKTHTVFYQPTQTTNHHKVKIQSDVSQSRIATSPNMITGSVFFMRLDMKTFVMS